MYGPILTTLADLHCVRGELEAGAALAERAVTVNQEHADTASWYADQAALTQKYCQALAGTKIERSALTPLAAGLERKWGKDSPFVQRSREQIRAIEKDRSSSRP
jgi:hypothetical protein